MAKKRFQQRKNKQNKKKLQDERRIKEEHIWDKIFLLHLKKSLYVIIIWALAIIIHELISKYAEIDEPYLSAVSIWIIPLYLLISIIYTLLKHKKIEG